MSLLITNLKDQSEIILNELINRLSEINSRLNITNDLSVKIRTNVRAKNNKSYWCIIEGLFPAIMPVHYEILIKYEPENNSDIHIDFHIEDKNVHPQFVKEIEKISLNLKINNRNVLFDEKWWNNNGKNHLGRFTISINKNEHVTPECVVDCMIELIEKTYPQILELYNKYF